MPGHEAAVSLPPRAPDAHSQLALWPLTSELRNVDLSLEDRDRVSALPWRGQFSPLTAERLLSALAPQGSLVLDPFVGSGTTLLEAARRGHPAVGLDINPAAVALATCVQLAALRPCERGAVVREAAQQAFSGLRAELGSGITTAHALALLAHVDKSMSAAGRRVDALLAALPETPVPVSVRLGDARATGLRDREVAFVVTSPPYINVFNYHQYGRPLSDSFGWPILAAARSEIGSNRQNRGNRFRTVVQYAVDMALVLVELSRVVVPEATVVLVLGRESRVRGVPFLNGEIVARLETSLGLFREHSRAERRFVSRFGQTIVEDVLVLHGCRHREVDRADAIAVGRVVGRESLMECAPAAGTHEDVAGAIAEAASTGPSPIAASSS